MFSPPGQQSSYLSPLLAHGAEGLTRLQGIQTNMPVSGGCKHVRDVIVCRQHIAGGFISYHNTTVLSNFMGNIKIEILKLNHSMIKLFA